jgi:hypothetical protein
VRIRGKKSHYMKIRREINLIEINHVSVYSFNNGVIAKTAHLYPD